ncbi:MAG: hypothetical protein IPN73_09130 [Saprospiraceae bacterium]|nr:hypothetical protein [Saprospiraceae bacterium]
MLYKTLTQGLAKDIVYHDSEVHEYNFVLATNKTVCQIGYQSHPSIPNVPYQIEIIDSISGIRVLKESFTFSPTSTSYVVPKNKVFLNSGTTYTLRRTQTNWGNNIGNTTGRVASIDNLVFPVISGDLSITSSNFFQNGGPSINKGVPFIDLVFE